MNYQRNLNRELHAELKQKFFVFTIPLKIPSATIIRRYCHRYRNLRCKFIRYQSLLLGLRRVISLILILCPSFLKIFISFNLEFISACRFLFQIRFIHLKFS